MGVGILIQAEGLSSMTSVRQRGKNRPGNASALLSETSQAVIIRAKGTLS